MTKKRLPAAVLTAALFVGGTIVAAQAGHVTTPVHGEMPHPTAYHGAMSSQQWQEDTARLGVTIAEVPQADLDRLSLEYGVRVQEVLNGSVAAAAGIQSGDLVTAIDDRPAYSPERLQHLVKEARGSSKVTVSRGGENLTLDATFPEPQAGNAMLGVRIQEMTDELKEAFGTEGDAGVLVSQVIAGSAAKQAGLKAGDVIVSLGKDVVKSPHQVKSALKDYAPGDVLDIAYVRDHEQQTVKIELGMIDSHPRHAQAMHPHGMLSNGARGHDKWVGHGFHGHHGMMSKHGCKTNEGQRDS